MDGSSSYTSTSIHDEKPRMSLNQPGQNTYRIDPTPGSTSQRTTDPPLLIQEDFKAGKYPSNQSSKCKRCIKHTNCCDRSLKNIDLCKKTYHLLFITSKSFQMRDVSSLWNPVRVGTMLSNGIMTGKPIHVLSSGSEVAMATKTNSIVQRPAEKPA